jgi:hypothetical protein
LRRREPKMCLKCRWGIEKDVSSVCDCCLFSRGCFIFIAVDTYDKGCWVFVLVCSVEGNFLVILIGYVSILLVHVLAFHHTFMCLHMSPYTHTHTQNIHEYI